MRFEKFKLTEMIARSLITIGYWVGLHLHFERIGGYITSALTRCLSVD